MTQKPVGKTVHFVALGCPKNRVDTEVLAGFAAQNGLRIVAEPDLAEIIVVATCGFIGPAREESVGALLEMARYKRDGRCQKLVATGCMAQRYGDELAEELPEVDGFLGTSEIERFCEMIAGEGARVAVGPAGHFLPSAATPRFTESGTPSAYIKIADGCSRRCAFCAIPGIRGTAHSRPIADISEEARTLVSRGVVELNLVAQDTSAYGADLGDGTDLVSLVSALERVEGVRWIRLLYLYPDGVPDALLDKMASSRALVPYLDVPIQHAGAEVLKQMRRGHGPAALKRLVERAKSRVPGIFLRTAVLVGHPGETDEQFDHLLEFVRFAEFHHLGAFRYSPEEGTASFGAEAPGRRVAYNRWQRVMGAQRKIARKLNRALVGTRVEVLVEGADDGDGLVLKGRHRGQAPEVDGVTFLVSCRARVGDIVEARVIKAVDHDLVAEPL